MHFLRKNDFMGLSNTFDEASRYQKKFLQDNKLTDYSWSTNPLCQWSRYIEYPFVINAINSLSSENLTILDYGAGKTFLPFYLNEKKHNVICYDIVDYSEYYKATSIDFTDNLKNLTKIIDVAYSVSVLEHTEDPVDEIRKIHSILKDDGVFIMTFDVDCRGDLSISLEEFQKMVIFLNENFNEISFFEKSASPLLTFENSKYGLFGLGLNFIIKRILIAIKSLFTKNKSKISPYDIRVGTFIGRKK